MEKMFTLMQCAHEFCQECVRAHLEKLIEGCEVSKLKCLDYECPATFVDDELKQILSEEKYVRM